MTAMPVDYEPDAYRFGFDPGEDYPEFDPEYDPERTRPRNRPYSPTVSRPQPRPQSYTPGTQPSGTVTKAELNRALQRVAADIDRLKAGARATTGQLNDLSDRTGRAFTNVRTSQQQQATRFERGINSTRELAVLSGVLGGGSSGSSPLLLLLLLGNDSGMGADTATGTGGGLAGNNSTLLLALALSGGLKP